MKHKKILFVGIIMLTLFTLSAVSASDNITSDSLAVEDTVFDEIETDDALQSSVDDEVLSANDSGMRVDFVTQDDEGKISTINESKDLYVNDHDSDYFRVKFTKKVTGTLTLSIDGKSVNDKEISSKVHYLFVNTRSYNLSEGEHTWKMSYSGDDDYDSASASGTFYLNPPSDSFIKKDSKMTVYIVTKDAYNTTYIIDEENDISTDYVGTDYFKVKFEKEVGGKLSLYIDDRFIKDKNITHKTHYIFVNDESYNLETGMHTWRIVYSGDYEYNSTSAEGTFKLNLHSERVQIKKPAPSLTVAKTKTYKTKTKTKQYVATLKANKKAYKNIKLTLTIKGKKFKKTFKATTDKNGKATFKITGLTKKGTYTGTITFNGNKNYKKVTRKLTIKVTKKQCKINRGSLIVAPDPYITNETKETELYGLIEVPEAFNLLNEFRAEKGVWYWDADDKAKLTFNTNEGNTLKPLVKDDTLQAVANQRVLEVVQLFPTHNLTHERPDHTYVYALEPAGYDLETENLAYLWSTNPEHLVMSYQINKATENLKEAQYKYAGQGHRRAMLTTASDLVGIAGYRTEDQFFMVQVFGAKK